ncbi:MAG: hypothetical protein ACHQRM_11370 [Bacteroidia bacterium]
MIYSKPLLEIEILFVSFRKKLISGVYRPHAYIKEVKRYCSTIRLDQFKRDIAFGDQVVMPAVIEAPVGFGKHLKTGVLLTIKDGLDVVGKAIVLEIHS